jgi:hypothetical protein
MMMIMNEESSVVILLDFSRTIQVVVYQAIIVIRRTEHLCL